MQRGPRFYSQMVVPPDDVRRFEILLIMKRLVAPWASWSQLARRKNVFLQKTFCRVGL